MPINIISKNSNVSGNVPTTGELALGEIGINTYDGKVFIKKDDGTAAIVEVGGYTYTHPTYAGDDADIDTGTLTGATVISDLDINVTTDTQGHVTDANATVSTRNLTAANIGASPTGHSHTHSDVTDWQESVEDTVGAMVSGNSESGITVTYDDTNGKLDFSVTGSSGFKNVTEEFTATNAQVTYTTTGFTNTADLQVFHNGLLLAISEYSLSTPDVTLANNNALAGDIISVKILDLGV